MSKFLARALRGALPYAVYKHFYVTRPEILRKRAEEERLGPALALASVNAAFHNKHMGQRCFILCNGPSVKQQDISLLKDEHVISVSSGYHHPNYRLISPEYHCVPTINYTAKFTRTDVVAWFQEMDDKLGNAILFLNYTEEALVREERLFPNREVRYVVLSGTFSDYGKFERPDISKCIPGVQSVPIMCLMIAIYMGFDHIYLIGTDHDQFRSREYKYFYEPTILRGKDSATDLEGNLVAGWYEELSNLAILWGQYRQVKQIAEKHGISIYNATAGGELDEFPRVHLDSLFP